MVEELDPYESPQSALEDKGAEITEIIPARRWLRFANFIIDYITFILTTIIYGAIVGLVWGYEGIEALDSIPDIIFGMILMMLYYIPTELFTGRTLGKLITGTRVVNEKGSRPTFGQIVGRCFCRFIPFEAFSFLSEDGRGWHDSIPKTYVVKCR